MPSTEDDWRRVSTDFGKKWNFYNCLGAVDGKHIAIRRPPNTGSLYYNYKKFFSIVLMAIVNSNYEFIMIDVGANGRVSDGGVVFYTNFWQTFINKSLNIPQENVMPNTESVFPFVFIGDDAFSLSENFMKPYSEVNLTDEKRIFNYRLSRARRVVENAFGILASRFTIFEKPMRVNPQKASVITLTCCYLHNFLIKYNKRNYAPKSIKIIENIQTGEIEIGKERNENQLTPLQLSKTNNTYQHAKNIRNRFCQNFNTTGQVPWQTNFIK